MTIRYSSQEARLASEHQMIKVISTESTSYHVPLSSWVASSLSGLQLASTVDTASTFTEPAWNYHTDTLLPQVVFYIKDHLGNTRVTYRPEVNNCGPNPAPEGPAYVASVDFYLQQVVDYYPYGKVLREYRYKKEKFKYQGSQEDTELGENLYYTHFRQLDNDVCRWWRIDPKTNHSQAPFNSMGGNPVMFNDYFGDTIVIWDVVVNEETGYEEWISVKYQYGMKYNGPSKYLKEVVADLNFLHKNNLQSNYSELDFIVQDYFKVNVSSAQGGAITGDMAFNSDTEIRYTPNMGLLYQVGGETGFMPSYVGLLHEIAHYYQRWSEDYNGPDYTSEYTLFNDFFGNKEDAYHRPREEWVITNVENQATQKLGLLDRNHHSGTAVPVFRSSSMSGFQLPNTSSDEYKAFMQSISF